MIVIKRESVIEVLLNPIIRTRIRYFTHAYHLTRDNILDLRGMKVYVAGENYITSFKTYTLRQV
jgi:hypothetical protein